MVATQKLFDVAAKEKVKHILFASSCSVYGYGEDVFTERSKLNPVDYYSETKIQGEAIAQAYKEDMAVTICRFATVFGASRRMRFDLAVNGMTANAVNRRECIIHGGQQWRPFIHCRDVARAIAIALAVPNEKISGDIYNVGDDKLNINLSGLGKVICSCIPGIVVKSDASITDNRSYKVAFASIRNKLGFAAEHDLKKGIKEIEMLVKSHLIPDPNLNIYSNVKTLEHNLMSGGCHER